MAPLALLLLAMASPPRTAVADLSVRPEPALAEALRRLPDLAGEPLPAKKAAMVVADAAKLGIVCSLTDARCLQKILVLARVDELVVFEVSGRSLSIARVTSRTAAYAKTRVAGGAAASARAAWTALERAAADVAPPAIPPSDDPATEMENETEIEDDRPQRLRRSAVVAAGPEETATAASNGVTGPLVLAAGAAGATVLLGAATVGVSAAVADQIRATERGVPLDEGFDATNAAFWALAGLTSIAAITAAVATTLFLFEDQAPADEVSAP